MSAADRRHADAQRRRIVEAAQAAPPGSNARERVLAALRRHDAHYGAVRNEHRDPGPAVSPLYAKLLREAASERERGDIVAARAWYARLAPLPSRAVDRVSNVPPR